MEKIGIVKSISLSFAINDKTLVLVLIYDEESRSQYSIFTEECIPSSQHHQYLQIGVKYKFLNVYACSSLEICFSQDDIPHILFSNSIIPMDSCSSKSNVINVEQITSSDFKWLYRPKSIYDREKTMHIEVNIVGKIYRKYHNNGILAIELICSTNSSKRSSTSFYIYFSEGSILSPIAQSQTASNNTSCHNILKFLMSSHSLGVEVEFHNLLPVYLWGRLHGFSFTCRSNMLFQSFPISTVVSCDTDNTISDVVLPYSKLCHVYISWYIYYRNRFKCALISSDCSFRKNEITSNDSEDIYNKVSKVLLRNTCEDIFECKHIPNTISSFPDIHGICLSLVRNDHDIDMLCSILPEIWTSSMIREYGERISPLTTSTTVRSGDTHECQDSSICKIHIENLTNTKFRHETNIFAHDIYFSGHLCDIFCDRINGIICCVSDFKNCTMILYLPLSEPFNRTSTDPKIDSNTMEYHGIDALQYLTMFNYNISPVSDTSSSRNGIILLVKNPHLFMEGSLLHNEQNTKLILMCNCIEHISVILNPNSPYTTSHNSLMNRKILASSSQFLLKYLVANDFLNTTCTSNPSDDNNYDSDKICTVRQLLLDSNFAHSKYISSLIGIVIFKELKVVNQNTEKSTRSCLKRSHDQSLDTNIVYQYHIVIRDLIHADIIHLYIPQKYETFSHLCLLGSVLHLKNLKAHISSNAKYLYLSYEETSRIDFIKLLDVSFLNYLSGMSASTMKESHYIDYKYCQQSAHKDKIACVPKPLPRISLGMMRTTRNHNRCMWNVIGSIVHIQDLEVFMRCSNCKSRSVFVDYDISLRYNNSNQKTYKCPRNCSNSLFEPWWQLEAVLDDGSGEAIVCIEGEQVFTVLHADKSKMKETVTSPFSPVETDYVRLELIDIRHEIEMIVCQCGYMRYKYSYHSFSQFDDISDAIVTFSNNYNNSNSNNSLLPHAVNGDINRFFNIERKLKIVLERYHDYSKIVNLSVRIIFNRKSQHKSESMSESVRKTKVQCVGLNPWQIDNISVNTKAIENLNLQCIVGSQINTADICSESYKILEKY